MQKLKSRLGSNKEEGTGILRLGREHVDKVAQDEGRGEVPREGRPPANNQPQRVGEVTRRILNLRVVPFGAVLGLRTTSSQIVKRFRGGLVFKAH